MENAAVIENKAVAKLANVRISPSKVKIVIDLIRNKPVGTALAILRNTPKAASIYVEKLLLSAMANAENNHHMDVESLYVAEIFAGQGPTLKRIQPRAQGRAFRINKRTSSITIVLKENAEMVEAKKAEKATKKPAKKTAPKAETKAEEAVDTKAEEAAPATTEEKPKKPRAPRKTTTTAKKTTAKKTAPKAEKVEEAKEAQTPAAEEASEPADKTEE